MEEESELNNSDNSNSMANTTYFDQIPAVYGDGGNFFDSQEDYDCASLYDMLQQHTPPPNLVVEQYNCPLRPAEMANTPTHNSSSISCSSNEAANNVDQENKTRSSQEEDEVQHDVDDDDDAQEKSTNNNKQLKPKKKNPKKAKQPRFAFVTKSDIDQLDDGYRWRKYGQKAVKNSPFPRSYHRCTSVACGVKKRVERSHEDPSIVITTYEGTHTHQYPMTPRGIEILPEATSYEGFGRHGYGGVSSFLFSQPNIYQNLQAQLPPYFPNQTTPSSSLSFSTINANAHQSSYTHIPQERHVCPSPASTLATDHGLLEDVIPLQFRKDEPEEQHN